MPDKDLKDLYHRYLNNDLTREELQHFLALLNTDDEQEIKLLMDQTWNQMFDVTQAQEPKVIKINMWKRIAVAASILFIIAIGAIVIARRGTTKQSPEIVNNQPGDVEAPKTIRAMITLADGRIVYLDSASNGTLATENNVSLIKKGDGQIVYNVSSLTTDHSPLTYNTLTNPRGSKVIDMTLADGSRVWLNAGSSVTYPVAFVGKERKVNITGEAYFEITHDATKPFIVTKGDMQVKVLGTHFNVNAYDDESDIEVTLLEGSVSVSSALSASSAVKIKPGQQAVVSNGIKILNGTDIDAVMAWKNGQFVLSGTDLTALMRQVARWYDVDIEYHGKIQQRKFGGTISNDVSLLALLQALKEYGISARLENKKVIID